MLRSGSTVEECGIFLSEEFPYLATSPHGVITNDNERFGLIEVKCPYKHRNNLIKVACKDNAFCLIISDDGQIMLNWKHDYYYQVTDQLALTGAAFCDLVVWTEADIHIEQISGSYQKD